MKQTACARVPFKIFGLQRTGTNLMSALLSKNFFARSIERWTEWKHGQATQAVGQWKGEVLRYVICVRNPYAWLLACHRYFQKAAGRDPTLPPQFQQNPSMSFEQFVTGPCYESPDPVHRWNSLYHNWLASLPQRQTSIAKQEDQLSDQAAVLQRLELELELPRREQHFRGISRRVDIIPRYHEPLRPEYYQNREYMAEYEPSILEHVNGQLDRDLLRRFGYSFEDHPLCEQKIGGIVLTIPAGCTEPVRTALDLYDFEQINRWSARIQSIVEIGAGMGATALLAKQYWPACEVTAYEASPQNLWLLRMNARRTSGVTPVEMTTMEKAFDDGLKHFGGEIDVLRISSSEPILPLLASAYSRGLLDRARWICGELHADNGNRKLLMDYLGALHSVETRATAQGERFLARRIRPPRLRADSTVERKDKLTVETAFDAASRFIRTIGDYPASRFRGRGIVICGGGRYYFPCAWVCINILRHLGVKLTIELWGLNASEVDSKIRALVEPLGVRCVDASRVRKRHRARILNGWELKPYAIIHSRFREVLFLDADNVAVQDPTALFEASEYKRHGAIFWPAYRRLPPDDPLWGICHVPYRDEPDFETGQIVIDKKRCWEPLQLTMHLNENSDFYYRYTQGDKETFHAAWRMLGHEYAMISTPVERIECTACQHDFQARRMFQHRYETKWSFEEANPHVEGFLMKDLCVRYLELLRQSLSSQFS
jgi:hypothetical protein